MTTASCASNICWKCCPFSTGWFCSLVKDQVTIGMWVHFWVFNSIPLVYLSVAIPVPCSFLSQLLCSTALGQAWWFHQRFFYPWEEFLLSSVFCYSRWICRLPFLIRWRIELEFWWGLHWICRLLLARKPFLQCWSCQSMSMGDLSIFWDLL